MGWGSGNLVSGFGGFNFKLTGNPKPTNATENTIWVDTDTEITEWAFSPTSPDNPVDGMVWVITGIGGAISFNALKKNRIILHPLSAKQYIQGSWVDVVARSFVDGAWIEWLKDMFLFDDGETFDDVTGGWTGINGGQVTSQSLYLGNNGFAAGQVWTNNAVNVSGYSQLKITISETNDTVKAGLLADAPTSDNYGNDNEGKALALASTTGNTLICDVSALSGEYYVWITRASGGGDAETHSAAIATVELVVQSANSGVAMLMLTSDTNTPVQAEIDGQSYGIENATVNEEPTATTYDFTVL